MTSIKERAPQATAGAAPGAHQRQKVGGVAAFYLALALVGAMPYFLLVVDYPRATTAADKVSLVVENYPTACTRCTSPPTCCSGMAVALLALALHDRFAAAAPTPVRAATAVGLLWSFALVTSGLVFTYGMTTIVDPHRTDPAQAEPTWQAIEPVAMALGGAGGELLGGLWVLLLSIAALRTRFPRTVSWLGLVIGVLGVPSFVPPLHNAAIAFGLLQIVWFLCVGWILVATPQRTALS